MKNRNHKSVGKMWLALLLTFGATWAHAQSTTAQPSRSVVATARSSEDALLREVRLIRETLQRAQGSAQREQMLVERIRTHDQRVERIDQQLSELRDEISGTEVHIRQTDDRDKSLELQVQRAHDSSQRQALEAERKEMKFTQEAQRQRLDRLRERESILVAAMSREERTLRGLEARLEALDRELEADARKH
jgi:predicted  nucleic acid-binding Zn-ribbon protein